MDDIYVDRNYSKYLNQDVIVIGKTDMLPKIFCAKFLDFTDNLLLRKPIKIKVSMCSQLKTSIIIRKDQYSAVISKELPKSKGEPYYPIINKKPVFVKHLVSFTSIKQVY